jgi:hypothetical protein
MSTERPKLTLPKIEWKTAECEVCGKPFDYSSKKRPHVCRDGTCRYKWEHKIDPDSWARHQPTLFESK